MRLRVNPRDRPVSDVPNARIVLCPVLSWKSDRPRRPARTSPGYDGARSSSSSASARPTSHPRGSARAGRRRRTAARPPTPRHASHDSLRSTSPSGRSGDALHREHVPTARQASGSGGCDGGVLESAAASMAPPGGVRPAGGRTLRSVAEADAASCPHTATSLQVDGEWLGRPLYPAQQWRDRVPRGWSGVLRVPRHRPQGIASDARRGGGAARQSPDRAAAASRTTRRTRARVP